MKHYYLSLFFEKIFVKDGKVIEVLPSPDLKSMIRNGKIRVRVSNNLLPLRDLFINEQIEFEHGLEQTKVFLECLGFADKATLQTAYIPAIKNAITLMG